MYNLIIQTSAEKFLKKLDKKNQERILNKFEDLKKNPELGVPLTGNLAGLWKLRIGDYRAIYQIKNSELLIFILRVGHRKNIYQE